MKKRIDYMKDILFELDEFCGANHIEYIVTGTMALSLLGVPSCRPPQDIDIKVFHLTEEQTRKLEELQSLSGLKNENYDHSQCFSFIIGGEKINAIIDGTEGYDGILSQCVCIEYFDEKQNEVRLINVQLVKSALADKMKLYRSKDKTYLINLIITLLECLKK